MGNAGGSPYSLKSVSHALRVLDLLVESRAVQVRDAARLLGVAPSTVRRLLLTLVEGGYATQDPLTRVYRPGVRVLSIQDSKPWGGALRAAGHAAMVRLRDSVRESVSLSVRQETDVVFIDGADSLETLRASPRVGARLPAYATAGGKVQLAGLSAEKVARLYPARLAQLTPRTTADRDSLLAELARVRRAGHCISHGESTRGLSALSVPLRPDAGRIAAALSVVAPTERFRHADIAVLLNQLHQAARRIEADVTAVQLRAKVTRSAA